MFELYLLKLQIFTFYTDYRSILPIYFFKQGHNNDESFKRIKEALTNVFNFYLRRNTDFSTTSSLQTDTSPQSLSQTLHS